MPHLVRWNEELGPFGLVVIGAEVQGSPADEITAKSKALRIRFTVTQGGGVADAKGGGIPHTVLFDHTGKMRFEGHPGDPKLLNHVLVALGTSFVEKTGKSTFSKAVQPLADALKKGAAPVPVLQKLLPLQKKDEDAKALIEVMTATGKTQVDEAAELVESDPVSAYLRSQQLSGYYKGTSVGTKANEIFTKLKNNKSVVLELKARPSLDGATAKWLRGGDPERGSVMRSR